MPHPLTTEAQTSDPELTRLRQRCAELEQQLENLHGHLDACQQRELVALADANFWHDQALSLVDTAAEAGLNVGMTADGHMGVMRDFTPVTDAASAVALLNPSAGRLQ